jgi:hypothetical protein
MSKVRVTENWDKLDSYEEKFSTVKKKGKHKRANTDTKKRKVRERNGHLSRQERS